MPEAHSGSFKANEFNQPTALRVYTGAANWLHVEGSVNVYTTQRKDKFRRFSGVDL